MNDSKISVRYAKALYELAQKKNLLEQVKQDMAGIESVYKKTAEFKQFIEDPVLKQSVKRDIMQKLFTDKVEAITLNFLLLTVQNKRENYLADITRMFLEMYRKNKGIISAVLTTAVNIDEAVKKNIVNIVKTAEVNEVELTSEVNKDIIGGFVLKVDDVQYDASTINQLKKLKRNLLQTSMN